MDISSKIEKGKTRTRWEKGFGTGEGRRNHFRDTKVQEFY